MHTQSSHHVVIIGGGFGGLYAAKALAHSAVQITLIDKRNFHLFQPLLYQVATGGLSPGDISSPLRAVLSSYKNIRVLTAEAIDIDPQQQMVMLRDDQLAYDTLIIATGSSHHYFGNDTWAAQAPGLKTIEDALEIRRRILLAFEAAERETDPARRRAWMNFVIVGGGPTGVELAGALGELAQSTLRHDFRSIDPSETQILLIEGTDRILPAYPPGLSVQAARSLAKLGVTVEVNARVTDIQDGTVTIQGGDRTRLVAARTVLWGAGMRASTLGHILAERTGVELDRAGRVMVTPNLDIPNYANIFVIGDLANYSHQNGKPLPGVAQVAMQQGQYVADLIRTRQQERRNRPGFYYHDRGSLAVVGRNAAVADLGTVRFSGIIAWLIWVFVHIGYLIEFDNRLVVMIQWAWNYFTRKRGARLITGEDPYPLVQQR